MFLTLLLQLLTMTKTGSCRPWRRVAWKIDGEARRRTQWARWRWIAGAGGAACRETHRPWRLTSEIAERVSSRTTDIDRSTTARSSLYHAEKKSFDYHRFRPFLFTSFYFIIFYSHRRCRQHRSWSFLWSWHWSTDSMLTAGRWRALPPTARLWRHCTATFLHSQIQYNAIQQNDHDIRSNKKCFE